MIANDTDVQQLGSFAFGPVHRPSRCQAVSGCLVEPWAVKRGRCAPSVPGASRATGFTLVELLVVLAIAGLLIALAPPVFSALVPGFRVKTAARELASDLRDARRDAITRHQETALVLKGRIYRRADTALERAFPRSVRLEDAWVPGSEREKGAAWIRFFPDGSASGARVRLGAGSTHLTVAVNWLTGRVSIDQ